MYARHISFRLKPNMQSEYACAYESQVRPMLLKQNCFKQDITLFGPGTTDAASISLWENKASADEYNTNTYPGVLKNLAKVIDGTPRVHAFETVISTLRDVAGAV